MIIAGQPKECKEEDLHLFGDGGHRTWCYECGPFLEGDKKEEEPPPLSVHVSEAMGAKSKLR